MAAESSNPATGQVVPTVRVTTAPVAGDQAMTVTVSFEVTIQAKTVINNPRYWPSWALKGKNEEVQEALEAVLAQSWPELVADTSRHTALQSRMWGGIGPDSEKQMSLDELRQTFQEILAIDRKYGNSFEYSFLEVARSRGIDLMPENDET